VSADSEQETAGEIGVLEIGEAELVDPELELTPGVTVRPRGAASRSPLRRQQGSSRLMAGTGGAGIGNAGSNDSGDGAIGGIGAPRRASLVIRSRRDSIALRRSESSGSSCEDQPFFDI
jgi:hypothetical protein